MHVRRGGLGRGLGALIPAGPDRRTTAEPVRRLRRAADRRDRAQPAAAARGLRRRGAGGAGHQHPRGRRAAAGRGPRDSRPVATSWSWASAGWRASRRPAWRPIPAIVRETGDDAMLRDALLENLHRQQLNPLEEAAAYQQLLAEFGATHEELADRIGRSRSQVSNTIRLLGLPPTVQRRVAAGVLQRGPRARAAGAGRRAKPRSGWRPGSWPRACRSGRPKRLVATGERPTPRARAPRAATGSPALARLAESAVGPARDAGSRSSSAASGES